MLVKILLLNLVALLLQGCAMALSPRLPLNGELSDQRMTKASGIDNMEMVDTNFTKKELTCQCGCGAMPSEDSQRSLFGARHLYGDTMVISRAARCRSHNAAVGGKSESRHIVEKGLKDSGDAYDVMITDLSKTARFHYACYANGFHTVVPINAKKGLYHIDKRPVPKYWFY